MKVSVLFFLGTSSATTAFLTVQIAPPKRSVSADPSRRSTFFLARSDAAMEQLAREWASRNKDDSSSAAMKQRSSGSTSTVVLDPSMPPGGHDFNMMNYPSAKESETSLIKGWVMGENPTINGSRKNEVGTVNGHQEIDKNGVVATSGQSLSPTPDMSTPSAHGAPVAPFETTNEATATKVTVSTVSSSYDDLAKAWASRNKDAEKSVRQSGAAVLDPPSTKPPGPSIEDLARQWAARHKDNTQLSSPSKMAASPIAPIAAEPPPSEPAGTRKPTSAEVEPTLPFAAAMDDLAKAWSLRNQDLVVSPSAVTTTTTSPKAAVSIPTSFTPASPGTLNSPSVPAVSIDDLAKEWAARNRDHATSKSTIPPKLVSPPTPPFGRAQEASDLMLGSTSSDVEAAASEALQVEIAASQFDAANSFMELDRAGANAEPERTAATVDTTIVTPPSETSDTTVETRSSVPLVSTESIQAPPSVIDDFFMKQDGPSVEMFPIKFWVSLAAILLTLVPVLGQVPLDTAQQLSLPDNLFENYLVNVSRKRGSEVKRNTAAGVDESQTKRAPEVSATSANQGVQPDKLISTLFDVEAREKEENVKLDELITNQEKDQALLKQSLPENKVAGIVAPQSSLPEDQTPGDVAAEEKTEVLVAGITKNGMPLEMAAKELDTVKLASDAEEVQDDSPSQDTVPEEDVFIPQTFEEVMRQLRVR